MKEQKDLVYSKPVVKELGTVASYITTSDRQLPLDGGITPLPGGGFNLQVSPSGG